MTCVQPALDPSGRFVKHGSAYVRCGKPAGWTCAICADPLCERCANDRRWNHYGVPIRGRA